MKTININLIGEFKKTVKSRRIELQEDTLDPKVKVFLIFFVLGTFVILLINLVGWLAINSLSKKSEKNLNQLKTEYTELKKEETFLSEYTKDIKNKKKIAEFKILAKHQINDMFMPWSQVLKELAGKVPRSIIITDIKKVTAGRSGPNKLNMSGIVSAREKPITEISFFLLNINEDKNSLLNNAKFKEISYQKEANLYEFVVEAELKK